MLHALPQALLLVDANSHIIEVNIAAEPLLGIGRKHLLGTALPAPLKALVERSQAQAIYLRESISCAFAPTAPLALMAQACPMDDPAYTLLLLEPASAALPRPAQAPSVMAAMLAHEIKNPLSGIRGAAQLLEKKAAEADKPLTEMIRREVDRITALLQKMEFFSDAPALCDDAVNIHEALEVVRLAATSGFAQGITIDTRYDPSLPPVRGNHTLLVQLFTNLIKNAAEALEGRTDGRITLTTRYRLNHTRQTEGGVRQSLPIMAVVEDNGPGIAESIRAHLFQPFVTTRTNGSGLGLAICGKIIADHGGSIEINSPHEGGTAIIIGLTTAR